MNNLFTTFGAYWFFERNVRNYSFIDVNLRSSRKEEFPRTYTERDAEIQKTMNALMKRAYDNSVNLEYHD